MVDIQRFGDARSMERPDTMVLGIGGAGRNILSSLLADSSLSNMDVYEVGINPRLHNCPFLKINKSDMLKAYESGIKLKLSPISAGERNLRDKIIKHDVVYFLSGLGGDVGSWTTPICSYLSRKEDILSIAFVTTPFSYEASSRKKLADESKHIIKNYIDMIVVFDNNKLFQMNPHIPMTKAFEKMNSIIKLPVKEFNRILTKGDLPAIKKFCKNINEFRIGVGRSEGRNKGKWGTIKALKSPWLDDPLEYKTVFTIIRSGSGPFELDKEDTIDVIKDSCPKADIMWAIKREEKLGNKIEIMILAGK